jgi:hypothetical protein
MHILTGLRHSKAHKNIYKGVKILHKADDNTIKGKKCHKKYDVTSPSAWGLVSREKREEEEINLSL